MTPLQKIHVAASRIGPDGIRSALTYEHEFKNLATVVAERGPVISDADKAALLQLYRGIPSDLGWEARSPKKEVKLWLVKHGYLAVANLIDRG